MNRVFHIIWSKALRAWVVVSELAMRYGKSGGMDNRPASANVGWVAMDARRACAEVWPLHVAITVALAMAFAPVHAANRHWDINGDAAGVGGTGTWNGGNLFWHSLAAGTGGSVFAWNNGAFDDAFFGGTVGTVTLAVAATAHSLNFTANGYVLNGNIVTLAGANPFITYTGANTATINSVLAGGNGLTVNGGSTNGWIQLGGTNTLTGGITLNSGARLTAAGSNSLNGAGNVVTVNGGAVLQINNPNAFGGNTAAANLVLNAGGNLWLGNTNLTHDITAHGGTVVIADVFANGNSTWTGNLVLTANTTLLVNNSGANDNLFFAGNLTDTGSNRLSLVLNEGGGIDSSLQLTGTNAFTGGITVNAGQLILAGNDSAAAGAGNVVTINGGIVRATGNAFGGDTDAAQLIINNGGVLRVDSNHTLNHHVTLTGGTATIDGVGNATWNGTPVLTASTLLRLGVGGNTLTVRGPLQDTGANVLSLSTHGGTVRFNTNLGFSGDLTLTSGNTWFDGGSYTYTGDTIINSGATLLLNSTSLSPNSNIRYEGLNNGNATVIYGTAAVPNITIPLGTGGGQLRWNGTGGFYALNNQSDVTVNLGGAGTVLAWADGLFVPDGHALILGTNVTGGDARQLDFQNAVDLSGGLRQVRADNGNIADHAVMSGVLTGTGGLQVVGNGLLEVRNTGNNYSGATVVGDNATSNVGNLLLGNSAALSSNSNLQINGAGLGTLEHHGGYVLLNAASGPFTRALGTGAAQVQWTASGGFGAIGAPQTVNIGGAGAMLTWGSGGFVPTGHALRFGGNYANSRIEWQNGIDLGAVDRTINVNEGVGAGYVNTGELEVSLNGVIQGAGGLILRGGGDVALNGLNTYSGTTWLGGVNITDGSNMWVWANTLADAGVASSLGIGSTVSFNSHGGGLIYTGGTTSTNRTLALNRTNGANHYLFNYGTGALTWSGDVTTTGSGVNNLRLGGTYATTLDASGVAIAPNVISGVISDGTGITAIRGWNSGSCTTGGTWRLIGANTFTGELFPETCVFEVTTIADAGVASAVGAGDLIADFRGTNGTVRYIGDGDTTDRLFWSWGDVHLESSGTGPLVLTNPGLIVDRNGGFTQWLGGSNTGDNLFAPTLVNGLTTAEFHGSANIFTLAKNGTGLWALTTNNNGHQHAYVGNTRVLAGALRLDDAGAITGGVGTISSHGTTGSAQRSSLIVFEGTADGTGGVIGLTAESGGFFRGTTTTSRAWQNNNGTTVGVDPDGPTGPLPAYGLEALDDDNYIQGVRWQNSGGFAAWDGTQIVNLFGDAREVTWGTGGFVPAGHQLVFGYTTADGTVDFRNAVNLGSAARTVHVNDGTAPRDAIMSATLRSTTVLGGLTKTGTGALTLTADNTYTGVTSISAGTLEIGAGGTTGSMGTGAQALVASGATLVANRSNAYGLSQAVIGDGTLVQRGSGTTTMSASSDIDHVVMEQGRLATPATLLANDVLFTDAGGATLQVAGALRTSAGGAVAVTGGAGDDTIRIDPNGNMLANGSLGAGSDTLDVAGTLDTGGGSFDLADGDDAFLIHDNTNVVGTVLGGAGIDTLDATLATTANLTTVQGFETLTKNGAGVLHLNGPGASDLDTVDVNAGTLDVAAGASIVAMAGGTLDADIAAGATLNVAGAFGCGDGNDSITIAGNITGNGTINQCGGDDTLTLRDGASVAGYTGVLDGGANTAGIGDTVQLDIAGFIDFAQGTVANYENLVKSNTGTALLSGDHAYSGGTTIAGGTLDVDGSLTTRAIAMTNAAGTTTLNVDGLVQGAGATQALITGGAGANVVSVNAGATLLADGNLGDGADVLDVAGTLDTGAGSFDLALGDDIFVIHDNTQVIGTVGGGAGTDTLDASIATSAELGVVQSFETLTKTGVGRLRVGGAGTSDFTTVNVDAGTLEVAAGANIAGTAGALATTVASGATLQVDGSYGCGSGNDTMRVGGTVSGSGTIDLCGGEDVLTLTDGAVLASTISGGAQATGDTVVLDNAIAMDFDASRTVDFEFLRKDNLGEATLVGTQGFSGGTAIDAGILTIEGSLVTPVVAMADNSVLNVDGLLQAAGAMQATITGSAGANDVVVGATGTLLANGGLGDGNDTLDVAGTFVTGGVFDLGAGDDTFIVHDGTNVVGTVDGGVGLDTRVFDLTGVANVGAMLGFEGLTKRGTGTFNLTGPSSELVAVRVEGGLLNVQAGAVVAAQAGSALDTVVLAGATLNVDGSYTASAGSDVMDVAGVVSGTGTIDLAAGDDRLVLNDGADLSGLANPIDGGAHGAGDTVVLNVNGNYAFADGQTVNFEILQKLNAGTATLTGTQAWQQVQLDEGTLAVAGTLEAPAVTLADGTVLAVDGTLQGSGGGYATLSGSAGTNTVTVNAGGTLRSDGTLGDGNDTLDVAGTLDTGLGTLDLGAGDDAFLVYDTTTMLGTVDGGAGNDLLDVNVGTGNTVPLGSLLGFESLGKSGEGALQINGVSQFIDVAVRGGVLDVTAGGSVAAQNTTVATGATLQIDGAYSGTTGDDTLTIAGTVSGNGTLALGDGADTFTIQDGADLSGLLSPVDGGAGSDTFVADLAGDATLGGASNFETLIKTNTGTLHVDGPAPSSFNTVNIDAGALYIGVNGSMAASPGATLDTVVAAGATLNVDGSYGCGDGNDTMDVSGTLSGSGTIALCDGDDQLVLNDGADLSGLVNPIDGGTNGAGDTVVLNFTGDRAFADITTNFEILEKRNAGTVTLTGDHAYDVRTDVLDGALVVQGTLTTPLVNLADATSLIVDGHLAGSSPTAIVGSAGVNTVVVNGTAEATADLGAGNDVLDVVGTLDTVGGTFQLGDGDDSFVVHDGTVVIGTVDGGAGVDTRVYAINTTADLGALVNFEGVTKTGTGTLNINGPVATDLQQVQVLGGTLNVGPSGNVVASAGSALETVVVAGATLNVDGDYGCGDGNDTMDVSGTVSGSGTIALCGGEDRLVLNDGADLSGLANPIDGGAHGAGDTVVLNVNGNYAFADGQTVNFEILQKLNAGTATLTGTQAWQQVQLDEGTLAVAGTLEAPAVTLADGTVLAVDGTLQGSGGGYATLSGSAGTNTVTVNAGGTLRSDGTLGDGNDTLDVAGTLDTGLGTLDLGAGDDAFLVYDTTTMLGTVDGGAGNDLLDVNVGTGNTVPLGSLLGFESLGKSGEGALQINGVSQFIDVAVRGGVLDVTAGGSVAAQNTTVATGATLQIDGAYSGTTGDDTLTIAGTVSGNGTLALGDGADTFTIQDGADLSGLLSPVDGGAGSDTFVADLAGDATLGGASNFETLIKTNTGTLHVDGPAPSSFNTVNIDAGALDIGAGGRLGGVQSSYVAMGSTLNVDGVFAGSAGDDLMQVAGTVSGSGSVGLGDGDGDDRLFLMQGAALGGLVNALDGGAGTDSIDAQVDTTMVLGPTVNFETLRKSGEGALSLDGDQAYATTQVGQGRLDVAAGTQLRSRDTTVDVGATLDVQGTFAGTDGNDTFLSMGTVRGALSFGAGDDSAQFTGGDLSGLTGLDGGAGGGDVLRFSLQELDGGQFATLGGWERVELLGSRLALDDGLDLPGGTLFVDNLSQLTVNRSIRVGRNVENAGRIDVGANRVAIDGDYIGGGFLHVTVSPANGTSGGLDIDGNVSGTTGVVFSSDGTDLAGPTSIRVISAANVAAGAFVPTEPVDGFVRLEGSVYPWTFAQNGADNNWYLGTDAGGVLPEIPGYAVLPTVGALMAEQGGDVVLQRLAGVRGDVDSPCPSGAEQRPGTEMTDDCHGFWMAAATDELELGANPGFELSGDDVGLYMGFDQALSRENRVLRFGGFVGLLHSNYWTTGVNSTDLPGVGESDIDLDTPVGGLYFSNQWTNGAYVDAIWSGQRPRAYVRTADGFDERLVGNSLTLNTRAGWRHGLSNGWTLEPQVQVIATQVHWQDTVDGAGRELAIEDDTLTTARAGLRAEKAFETAGGTSLRPWATLSVQDTYGENVTSVEVTATGPNAAAQWFPNHDRGTAAALDIGMEATISGKVSVFGVVSLGQDLDGTDYEHRAANLGVRVRW